MKFIVKGQRPPGIRREEIRAILHATDVILSFHNKQPVQPRIIVMLANTRDLGKCKVGGHICCGRADIPKCIITIARLDFEGTLTTLIHEMIHLYLRFPDDECEKLTSTLTAKIKNDVYNIARALTDQTYVVAAYIAHCKIAYRPKGDDFYDDDQHKPIGKEPKKFRERTK